MSGPRVLVVLGTSAWRSWIDSFLEDERYSVEILEGDAFTGLIGAVHSRRIETVVFLSHHDTLRDDLCFLRPLPALGVRTVVCHPDAVVSIAMDKRQVAELANGVASIRAVPEFTPEGARRYLDSGDGRIVIAKPVDGTEGQEIYLFRESRHIVSTGARLYEGGFLLQPFVHGREYSVNMVWHEGRCNVYAPVDKGPVTENCDHPSRRTRVCPAQTANDAAWSRLLDACVEFMRPLRPSGPVEMEFIRARDGFYLLDVNPRVSATLRLTAVASASNPFSDLLAAACGAGELGSPIPAARHAIEWPAPEAIDEPVRAALDEDRDLWISTRITLAAPDEATLLEREAEIRAWLG